MYGGSAGGGKSQALLEAALQFVHIFPGYTALLLRRTFAELALPEALMDRAKTWLIDNPGCKWNEKEKTFIFHKTKARLVFGFMETENDRYRYQSFAAHFFGYDELTQFTERMYTYIFSRMRRLKDSGIPMRFRSATNPGGVGHEWVYRRFVDPHTSAGRVFIPATVYDSIEYLDVEDYVESMKELDPVTREQMLNGNWEVRDAGGMFKAEDFLIVKKQDLPPALTCVRYWDTASTEPTAPNPDPDYTVGVLLGYADGLFFILDVQRFRLRPSEKEKRFRQTAEFDTSAVPIYFQKESASTYDLVAHYRTTILMGYRVILDDVSGKGNKVQRAQRLAALVAQHRVRLLEGPWNKAFIDEAVIFPQNKQHDDQVDAASGAINVAPLDDGIRYTYMTESRRIFVPQREVIDVDYSLAPIGDIAS